MCKEFELIYDEKTGTWREKKEPFAKIEFETEADYKLFTERLEKQKAKKPIPPEINEDFAFCPSCKRIVYDIYNYCPGCGQKLDWSIKND